MFFYNSLKVKYLSYSKATLHQRSKKNLFSFFSVCGGLDYYPSPLQNLLKKTITTKQISLLQMESRALAQKADQTRMEKTNLGNYRSACISL